MLINRFIICVKLGKIFMKNNLFFLFHLSLLFSFFIQLISHNFAMTALAVSSTNYGIPQFQIPDFGGKAQSEHYILDATGGPIVGVGSSANYGLDTGFPSVTGGTITLAVNSSTVSLGSLVPGTPITAQSTITVATDVSAGYNLAIEKNQLLTHASDSDTIPDFSGTIASPSAWSGTGFGFSVNSGTNLEAKWGSGSNFAALPTQSSTTYHSVAQAINAPDNTVVGYKLDTANSQKSGSYSTIVSYLATVLP